MERKKEIKKRRLETGVPPQGTEPSSLPPSLASTVERMGVSVDLFGSEYPDFVVLDEEDKDPLHPTEEVVETSPHSQPQESVVESTGIRKGDDQFGMYEYIFHDKLQTFHSP
jgi:hypothetical protein